MKFSKDRSIRLARRLVSALEDRINLLIKKYPDVKEKTIRELAEYDPTKGSILEWLVRQVKNEQLRFPEDEFRLSPALKTYLDIKKSPRLLTQHQVSPDINKYTFHDLEAIYDKLHGTELRTQRQTLEESKQQGTKVIYDTPPYKIIQIGGPGVDLGKAAQAACTYAKNTKWCTSQPETAKNYLKASPLYIIFENNEKIAQTDKNQIMDIKDNKISIKDNLKLWKLLADLDIISPALYSYNYALDIIQERFPAGEPAIAQSAEYSYYYARKIIKERFPEGEQAISQDAPYSYYYARNIIKERFPAGEPVIAQYVYYSYYYARNIIKERFPAGEPVISQDAEYSYYYALHIIKERFPAGEPAISQDAYYSRLYKRNILDRAEK